MNPKPTLTFGRAIRTLLALLIATVLVGVLAFVYGTTSFDGMPLLLKALSGTLTETDLAILWGVRLPRVVMASFVGAALACSGACLQALLRNPLADPYVLGISGGAALGGTLFMSTSIAMLLPTSIGLPMSAFIGAAASLGFLYVLESWFPSHHQGNAMLLLVGVIFNAFASAVIMFLKAIVSAQKAQEMLFYLMGNLSIEGMEPVWIIVVICVVSVCILGVCLLASDLNLMTLGEEEARALGVDSRRVRRIGLLLSSIMVAICVSFTGLIGFVGLVVPHGFRLWLGPDNRLLLPACALGGAAFLTACDLIARLGFSFFSVSTPSWGDHRICGSPIVCLLPS